MLCIFQIIFIFTCFHIYFVFFHCSHQPTLPRAIRKRKRMLVFAVGFRKRDVTAAAHDVSVIATVTT